MRATATPITSSLNPEKLPPSEVVEISTTGRKRRRSTTNQPEVKLPSTSQRLLPRHFDTERRNADAASISLPAEDSAESSFFDEDEDIGAGMYTFLSSFRNSKKTRVKTCSDALA